MANSQSQNHETTGFKVDIDERDFVRYKVVIINPLLRNFVKWSDTLFNIVLFTIASLYFCTFPQNAHTKKWGEISLFYAVKNLVIFTEEILNGKLHFLCSEIEQTFIKVSSKLVVDIRWFSQLYSQITGLSMQQIISLLTRNTDSAAAFHTRHCFYKNSFFHLSNYNIIE